MDETNDMDITGTSHSKDNEERKDDASLPMHSSRRSDDADDKSTRDLKGENEVIAFVDGIADTTVDVTDGPNASKTIEENQNKKQQQHHASCQNDTKQDFNNRQSTTDTNSTTKNLNHDSGSSESPLIEKNGLQDKTKPIDSSIGEAATNVRDTSVTIDPKQPKKKRRKRKANNEYSIYQDSIVRGSIGVLESFPELKKARLALNQRNIWFQQYPIGPHIPVKFIKLPFQEKNISDDVNGDNDNIINGESTFDWKGSDAPTFLKHFPVWKSINGRNLGTRAIPKCLLLDAKNDTERIVIINWWRSLSHDQQSEIVSARGLQRFYRAPHRSSSPFQYSLLNNKSNSEFLFRDTPILAETSDLSLPRGISHLNALSSVSSSAAAASSRVHPQGFRTISYALDLMKRLNLSIDELYCAKVLVNEECQVDSCIYPALDQNRGFCALHKQNWWPRTLLSQPQKRRGHLLLGPEYACRQFLSDIWAADDAPKVQPVPCGCADPLCEAIGWSSETVRMPKGYTLPKSIVTGPNRDKERPLRLAPWHFPPEARMQLPDGSWKILFRGADFVEPGYSIADFLEEPEMITYKARKSLWSLPDWVYDMQAVEEGPRTLAEMNTLELRAQNKQLRIMVTEAKLGHKKLTKAHSQATEKLQSMKKNYVHKRVLAAIRNPRKIKHRRISNTAENAADSDDDGNENNNMNQTNGSNVRPNIPGTVALHNLVDHPHSQLYHPHPHHGHFQQQQQLLHQHQAHERNESTGEDLTANSALRVAPLRAATTAASIAGMGQDGIIVAQMQQPHAGYVRDIDLEGAQAIQYLQHPNAHLQNHFLEMQQQQQQQQQPQQQQLLHLNQQEQEQLQQNQNQNQAVFQGVPGAMGLTTTTTTPTTNNGITNNNPDEVTRNWGSFFGGYNR